MPSRQKTLAAVGTGCTILALAAWAFYLRAFAGLHGDDWMVFYTAARTVVEGKLAILYDGDKLTTLLNARFVHWLAHPLILHPFLYPPHYLLILAPFGYLPFAAGGILFLVASFAMLVAALWRYAETNEERVIYALGALLCPAAAIVVCAGQNTFLTLSLLIGGLALAPRRPFVGGFLLGVLTFKPQLWLMVPFVLVATRQWKALAAAAASAVALMAASVVFFGFEPWRAWFDLMTSPSALYARWNSETRQNGLSIYNYVAFLNAPAALANAAQALVAIVSGGIVYWFHRRATSAELRIAVVLATTMLSSPHILLYDAMTAELAALLFFVYALRKGSPVIDIVVAVPVWLVTLINPPTLFAVAEVTPLLVMALIAMAVWRGIDPRGGTTEPEMAFGTT